MSLREIDALNVRVGRLSVDLDRAREEAADALKRIKEHGFESVKAAREWIEVEEGKIERRTATLEKAYAELLDRARAEHGDEAEE